MNDPKHLPINYEELLAKQAAEIAKRIAAPSGDTIRVNQNKTFTFPDQTETPGPFDAVIVDFISANFYYPASYNPRNITPPECYALGPEPSLLVPSIKAHKRQAENCGVCPHNQWGSAPNGNGKACRNHRILALLPPDADDDKPIMLLKLSPTALRHFDSYVMKVARMYNSPPVKVISQIGFDPTQDYPVVRFGPPQPNQNVEYFVGRMEEARQRLTAEPEFQAANDEAPAPGPRKATVRR